MTTVIIDFIFILLYYLHRKKSIDVNSIGHHDEFYRQLSHNENGVQSRLGTQSRNPQLTKLFKWPKILPSIQLTAKFVLSRCSYCKFRRNFGFFCSVSHFSEGAVNGNHNVTCSPSLAENDSRLPRIAKEIAMVSGFFVE